MADISVDTLAQVPVSKRRTEHVERKGIGHPDTICDSVMEAASVALSQAYIEASGQVQRHNLDKGLLVAGRSDPRLGGGRILQPMRLVFGDRATTEVLGRPIPVEEIVEHAARRWLTEHLRFVDPEQHLICQNEIQPGAPELVDIFSRQQITANDTSAAVGYAPLTETEQLVLEAERFLASPDFKREFPELGEDIKVMAFRRDRRVSFTVATAFVDRFVPDAACYFERKAAIVDRLKRHLQARLVTLDRLDLALNTLDDPTRGIGGMYLTVLGTSAESADGGQVGRGNRVNGLISLHRPMSTEAAAGKNPVSHVGKIYNLLAHQMAMRIYESIGELEEVNVWLCSQIGRPVADPWSVAVEMIAESEASARDFGPTVTEIVQSELDGVPRFLERLVRGELPVC